MAHSQGHDAHDEHHEEHGQKLYVIIGAILAVITAAEVAVTFLGLDQAVLVAILMVMMLAKGALVVLYFMHLKFDSRLFALLFALPLFLLAVPMVIVFMLLFSSHAGIGG